MASHVLNPVIERLQDSRWVDNPSGIGRHLDTYVYHAFCSCLWSTFGRSKEQVEDEWMDHMNLEADLKHQLETAT